MNNKLTVALLITITLLSIGILSVSNTMTASGKITATADLNIYKDSRCTQKLTDINWGTLSPGNSATYTIYIKNTGTAKQTLGLTTNNWSPQTVSQYLTITWDRNNTIIGAKQVVKATLTLTVSPTIDYNIATFKNFIIVMGVS